MSKCVECGATEQIHQHHTNYNTDKTVPLCASCHRVVHADEDHELYPIGERDTEKAMVSIDDKTRDELRKYKAEYGDTYTEAIQRLLESEGWDV